VGYLVVFAQRLSKLRASYLGIESQIRLRVGK
jgi:hypothetical protein